MTSTLTIREEVGGITRNRFPRYVLGVRLPDVRHNLEDVDLLHHRRLDELDDNELIVRRIRATRVLGATYGRKVYVQGDGITTDTLMLLASTWAADDVAAIDEEFRLRRARSAR
jgi:hypothetical protein